MLFRSAEKHSPRLAPLPSPADHHWPSPSLTASSLHYLDDNKHQLPPNVLEAAPSKRRRVTVEVVEDEDDNESWTHEKFQQPVASTHGEGVTAFSDLLSEQHSMRQDPYSPFRNSKEWGLAKWLMRETTQTGADRYLKLEIVSPTDSMQ